MTFSLTVSGGKFKNEKLTSWEFKGSTHHGRKKNSLHLMVSERENNGEHLRFRSAATCILFKAVIVV